MMLLAANITTGGTARKLEDKIKSRAYALERHKAHNFDASGWQAARQKSNGSVVAIIIPIHDCGSWWGHISSFLRED